MRDLTYEERIERTRRAIMRRVEQAREHASGSREHNAYLGTADTLLTGLLRNVEVAHDDHARLRKLIDDERSK